MAGMDIIIRHVGNPLVGAAMRLLFCSRASEATPVAVVATKVVILYTVNSLGGLEGVLSTRYKPFRRRLRHCADGAAPPWAYRGADPFLPQKPLECPVYRTS